LTAGDIQFAEVHDCFTIAEIVAIEDLGFVEKGEGGFYTLAGHTCLTGERPVNTSGGLKAKGIRWGPLGWRRSAMSRCRSGEKRESAN
jgi:Acetyl-CoA acetyltransferase